MRYLLATALLLTMAANSAEAAGTIGYGSRAGMEVDVVSMSGLDTERAVIRTKHTRRNAISFCRDYVGKVTESCIREELATRLNDQITANCKTGVFSNFSGKLYRYAGRSRDKDTMAPSRIVDVASGEEADGSSASGYPVHLALFQALCPSKAPSD